MSDAHGHSDEDYQAGLGRRVTETARSSRFLLLSLVIHAAIVVVLGFWSLPTVVELIVTKLHEADAALQPFDNSHQSHQDGQQAWEKLADVQSVNKTVDIIRRESEPINIPNPSENLQPTISVELASRLPSDRVQFTSRQETAIIREPQLSERTMASPKELVDVEDSAESMIPIESPPLQEPTIADAEPPPRDEAASEAAAPSRREPLFAAMRQPVELDEAFPEPTPDLPKAELAISRETSPATASELTDDPVTPVTPLSKKANPQLIQDHQILLERQPIQNPPATTSVRPAMLENPAGRRPREIEPREPVLAKFTEPRSEMLRDRPIGGAKEMAAGDSADPVTPVARNSELPERVATVELIRSDPTPPTIEVPPAGEIAGPSRPDQRLAIGELGKPLIESPPTFGPIVSQLNRPRARARRVVYAVDSVGLREMFVLRQIDVRKQHIELFGGTPQTESAVENGLNWLAAHQDGNGGWSLNNFHANCKGKHANCKGAGSVKSNTAATGLAILPFLASGYTHQDGPYQKQLTAAVNWLASHQKDTGDLLATGDQQHLYSHAIATIAVCELYGMTGDEKLRPLAEKALAFLVKSQHGGTGGWRYGPNQAADTSVVGWAVMALKSGEMSGIIPPKSALDNVQRWLKTVEGNKPVGGLFGYQNASATPAMTAEGLLCLQFMRIDRNDPRMRAGADYLLKHLPQPSQAGTSYYWYYGTQVMYHMQGKYWDAWNAKLRDQLVSTQVASGPMAGTWDVRDRWEKSGGRVYTTAIKLLMLEVYYRHLPLYEQLDD